MNTRSLAASTIACIVALGPTSSSATAPAEPDRPADSPTRLTPFADVRVAPEMMDPEYARSWVSMGITRGLADHPIDPHDLGDRRITVELGGNVAAYRISVGLERAGDWAGEVDRRDCKCTDQEMIEMVADMVAGLAERLEAEEASGTASVPSPSPSPISPEPHSAAGRARLGAMGKGGIGLAVLGAGLSAVGVAFLMVDRQPSSNAAADARIGRDFTIPGAVSLGVGVVGVAAGVAMILVDQTRARRRTRTTAMASWSTAGASFSVRF